MTCSTLDVISIGEWWVHGGPSLVLRPMLPCPRNNGGPYVWMYMPPLILKPNRKDLHELVRITMGDEDFCQQSTK